MICEDYSKGKNPWWSTYYFLWSGLLLNDEHNEGNEVDCFLTRAFFILCYICIGQMTYWTSSIKCCLRSSWHFTVK